MPMSPVMSALATVAMMAAMMLPSFAPALRRYHRRLHALGAPYAGGRTAFFALGYANVWTVISLAMFAMSAELDPMNAAFRAWLVAVVVLSAGALQRSRWKATRLECCREPSVTVHARRRVMAWRDGCRFGVHCALSCAAPMAVLLAAGLMDPLAMAGVTAAITAERVAQAGPRIASLTGALAVASGLVLCVRAVGLTIV